VIRYRSIHPAAFAADASLGSGCAHPHRFHNRRTEFRDETGARADLQPDALPDTAPASEWRVVTIQALRGATLPVASLSRGPFPILVLTVFSAIALICTLVVSRIPDAQKRVSALFWCEQLRAVPALPITFERCSYFETPSLRGRRPNLFGTIHFKDASIDTNWRTA
jgi:hypothetical protein